MLKIIPRERNGTGEGPVVVVVMVVVIGQGGEYLQTVCSLLRWDLN
jgi:hypothetical protein